MANTAMEKTTSSKNISKTLMLVAPMNAAELVWKIINANSGIIMLERL